MVPQLEPVFQSRYRFIVSLQVFKRHAVVGLRLPEVGVIAEDLALFFSRFLEAIELPVHTCQCQAHDKVARVEVEGPLIGLDRLRGVPGKVRRMSEAHGGLLGAWIKPECATVVRKRFAGLSQRQTILAFEIRHHTYLGMVTFGLSEQRTRLLQSTVL